jgi:hypothetical protein
MVLYFPGTHNVHAPTSPVLPAGHAKLQAVLDELPLGDLEPSGHIKHVDDVVDPNTTEYVLTPQSMHASLPLFVLYFPATHAEHEPEGPV